MKSNRFKHWFCIAVVVFLIGSYVLTIGDTEGGEPLTLGEYIISGIYGHLREDFEKNEDIQGTLEWLHDDHKFDISEQLTTFEHSREEARIAKAQRTESPSFEMPIDKAQHAKTYFDELIEACKGQNAYCDQKALEAKELPTNMGYSTRDRK
jgi:hypothetical protein